MKFSNFEISLIRYYIAWQPIDENLQFYLRIERSTATKSFVVIVAITNCMMYRSINSYLF